MRHRNNTKVVFNLSLAYKHVVKICGHSSVVERLVANEKVEGSTPFARSILIKIKFLDFNT